MNKINPIGYICPISNIVVTSSGHTYTRGSTFYYPISPTGYDFTDSDISASDAGRTDDGIMHKELIRNSVKANFTWDYKYVDKIKSALQGFVAGEYFEMSFYDPLYGSADNAYYKRYIMYCGDRAIKVYNTSWGLMEQTTVNAIDTCITPTTQSVTISDTGTARALEICKIDGITHYSSYDWFLGDFISQMIIKVPSGTAKSSISVTRGGVDISDMLRLTAQYSSYDKWEISDFMLTGNIVITVS